MIEKFESKEGLKVYVEPTPGIKNLDTKLVVLTGSVDETDEDAGISHALEHGLFLETPDFSTREASTNYSEEHAFRGGAYTTNTSTVFSAKGLEPEAMFHYLNQIVFHPLFGEESWKKELQTIRNEAINNLSYIEGLSSVLTDYVMFGSPYGRRVIGFADALNFSEEQLIKRHASHYSLDKMALVVSGDTTPEKVENLIQNHFDYRAISKTSEPAALPESTAPYGDEQSFGYLQVDQVNPYIISSIRQTTELQDLTRQQPWAYKIAMYAINRALFDELRYKKDIAYGVNIDNHERTHTSARRMEITTDVAPENVDIAFASINEVLERGPASYSDDELRRAYNSERTHAADYIDSTSSHTYEISTSIAHGHEPIDTLTTYNLLEKTSLDDVRVALGRIHESWQNEPHYETVAGTKEAIGKRAIIARELFA